MSCDNEMGNLISIQLAAGRPLKPIHQRIIVAGHIHSASTTTPSCHKGPFFSLSVSPLCPTLARKPSSNHLFIAHPPQHSADERKNPCIRGAPYPAPLNLLLLLLLGLWGRGNVVLLGLGRGVTTTDLLPWRGGIVKVSKRLGELKGFVDDPLLFVIVSDLGVTLWSGSVSGVWNKIKKRKLHVQ